MGRLFKAGDLITLDPDFARSNHEFIREGVTLLEVTENQAKHVMQGGFDHYILNVAIVTSNASVGPMRPGHRASWWAGRFKLVVANDS